MKAKIFSLLISFVMVCAASFAQLQIMGSCPPGTSGFSYSCQLTASGSSGTLDWSIVGGDLPTGLTLSSDGLISGTPTAVGSFGATIQATNYTQAAVSIAIAAPPIGSRGYVTTPGELAVVAHKASQGVQPYVNATLAVEDFANTGTSSVTPSTANPEFWPYGTISGSQSCGATLTPSFLGNGSPLVESKALVYGLLLPTNPALANQYAASIVKQLLELSSTSGYGGATYSGSNQCILNLSWYTPGWIIAADLIEGYSGWTSSDKQAFQNWLATVVYPKTSWASDKRSNNWGAAGSVTSGMIADYLTGSKILMVNYAGVTINSHDAYALAKQRQLDRMDGNSYMDNYNCGSPGQGIRPDGGIPEELARGTTSCKGLWILKEDPSWTYTQTNLEGVILDAEFLLRRGDMSIFNNVSATAHGSLETAYLFIVENPNEGSVDWPWNVPNEIAELEILYRYYRDPLLAKQLGVGTLNRLIGGRSGQMLHFGTVIAGFAVGENPAAPPVVSAP